MKRSTIIFAILGVVLIALAAVVRFVVVPSASKLPGDTDTTGSYAGTANLLDSRALQAGDVANAMLVDQPVAMKRHVYVSESDSNTAVVHDDSTIDVAGQQLLDNHTYAIDRTDLMPAEPPSGATVESHSGLSVSLPVGPRPDDSYSLYDPAAQAASPLKYVGAESRGGRDVYHYESTTAGDVKNQELLKTLPPALPSALAAGLLPSLPQATQQALAALGPLPETIPLAYSTKTTYGVWGDQQLGVPLAVSIARTVTAEAAVNGQRIALLPVLDIKVQTTDETVQSNADDAASAGRLLTIMKVWVPIALLVIGVLLIALALLRQRSAAAPRSGSLD